ncbi:Holliday junction branch migration protein RuvA [Caproiciproducens sp. MSJ-32]|uniref:Holliday junction branch migration protein RuvA n=1 Tax=Caproiciproducens sp. MSJ-32 TaxID=2841527 RepID=UPI001C10D16E|nr:Holliday junction branch migration protein RuvA [Caproiciproducens sp. MSJ-32]MBU5454315.1 Holliday junction branch migration protein RuvA [Caproiciproducens sp. MSJ-32]
MYEYICGKYKGINKDYIIVENNGIGYKIYTSGATMSSMPKIDEDIMLYLEQIVREDFIGLYGFNTREELEMFKLLLTINGVGAKAALSLLSISRINNLKYAIMMGDEKHLCKAPGIGKKTAARIILELKDKIKKEEFAEGISKLDMEDKERNIDTNAIAEALGALLALGYSEKEAEAAIKKVNKEDSLENIIKSCLKVLMG